MTYKQIQDKLNMVRDLLKQDPDWDKAFDKPKTSTELCDWIKENRPDIVNILKDIDFEEAKEHGFTVAIIAFGQLMK